MDDRTKGAIVALSPDSVRYLPASWEKRFARSIAERCQAPMFEPTPRQWKHIRRLAHRYRRQAPGAHSVLCVACGPPSAQLALPA